MSKYTQYLDLVHFFENFSATTASNVCNLHTSILIANILLHKNKINKYHIVNLEAFEDVTL